MPAVPPHQGAWVEPDAKPRARSPQQLHGLRSGNVAANGAFEAGTCNDLAGLAAGASVEIGDQVAHRPIAAGEQQFMELGSVVPPR